MIKAGMEQMYSKYLNAQAERPEDVLIRDARLEDVLKRDGRLVYHVSGTSMMPLIRRGIDLVDIRSGRQAAPYDIAFYRRRSIVDGKAQTRYVLHRILSDEGSYYLVLGDNCTATERIAKEDVLGTADAVLRRGRPLNTRGLWYTLYMHLWIRPWQMRIRLLKIKKQLRRGIAGMLPARFKEWLKKGFSR